MSGADSVCVTRLANGVRVLTALMPHMTSVAVGVWASVGGRHEAPHEHGICHFLEHMCFKGTKRRSARRIASEIESAGGTINAFTCEEAACYYAKVSHGDFERALDVLLDLYHEATFPAAEVARERNVIKEEIRMYLDMPAQLVYEDFGHVMYNGHPLGRPLMGTLDSIERIGARALRAFRDRHYTPGNTVVSVAGCIAHDDVVTAVRERTVGWRARRRVARSRVFRPRQRAPHVGFRIRPIEQAHVVVGVLACSRTAPERFALRVLSTILGETMSSRLNQQIREQRGLAYSIQSSVTHYQETGALQIGFSADVENVPRVLALTLRACAELAARGPSATELRLAKHYLCGHVALSLERTTDRMLWLGEHLVAANEVLTTDNVLERYAAVSADEVQRVARVIFTNGRLNAAIVSPALDEARIRSVLRLED